MVTSPASPMSPARAASLASAATAGPASPATPGQPAGLSPAAPGQPAGLSLASQTAATPAPGQRPPRRDIVLLGSTGSIGTQAADIVRRNPGPVPHHRPGGRRQQPRPPGRPGPRIPAPGPSPSPTPAPSRT